MHNRREMQVIKFQAFDYITLSIICSKIQTNVPVQTLKYKRPYFLVLHVFDHKLQVKCKYIVCNTNLKWIKIVREINSQVQSCTLFFRHIEWEWTRFSGSAIFQECLWTLDNGNYTDRLLIDLQHQAFDSSCHCFTFPDPHPYWFHPTPFWSIVFHKHESIIGTVQLYICAT